MINLIGFALLFLHLGFTGLDHCLPPFLPEKQAYPEPFCGHTQLLQASINLGVFSAVQKYSSGSALWPWVRTGSQS